MRKQFRRCYISIMFICVVYILICNMDILITLHFQLKERLTTEDQTQNLCSRQIQRGTDSTLNLGKQNILNRFTNGPSLEHQVALREIQRVSTEFWWYIRNELDNLKEKTKQATTKVENIDSVINEASDMQSLIELETNLLTCCVRKLQNDFYKMNNYVDNVSEWKKRESKRLGDIVQKRLATLQNPRDCHNAKKVVCNVGTECGFGCQLHHVTFCLLVAYATRRTLIFESKGWQYAVDGWETVFRPLSENCTTKAGYIAIGLNETSNVIELPIISSMTERPNYLPLAVPEDLAYQIYRFHGDPAAWWIGQFVLYLTRPNEILRNRTDEKIKELAFQSPIVGVHIRRTDKIGNEAAFHPVEEYMRYVEEWFGAYEDRNQQTQRKIFLASDDPKVIDEIKSKYQGYTILTNSEASSSATFERYSTKALMEVYLDVYLLSLCDYIVCTFSSNLCRGAYELMQTHHADASLWFKSLDDFYYFHGQHPHLFEAVDSHTAKHKDEISFSKGQMIHVLGNHWNGYSKGKNIETGEEGLFPSYKVVDKLRIVSYPDLPDH